MFVTISIVKSIGYNELTKPEVCWHEFSDAYPRAGVCPTYSPWTWLDSRVFSQLDV